MVIYKFVKNIYYVPCNNAVCLVYNHHVNHMSHEGVLKWATWIFFSSSLCLESFSFTLTSPFDEEKDYIDVFLVIGSAPTMVIVWDARWKSINLCSYHFCSERKDFWEYIFIRFLVRTISHMCIVEKGWPRSTFWGLFSMSSTSTN